MARKSRPASPASRKRSAKSTAFTATGECTWVGASVRTIAGVKRKVPTIILRGSWLKALGFPIDAPIYLVAQARGQMAICRPGLRKPRWLHIVAHMRQ